MTVKLKGTLPKGEADGLNSSSRLLIKEPPEIRTVVGFVRVVGENKDYEAGTVIPVIKFENVEMILDDDDAQLVAEILARRIVVRQGGATQLDIPPTDPQGAVDIKSARGKAGAK